MFTKGDAHDDTMSLVEAWQNLGERHRLAITSSNSEAIVATGVVRGRPIRVDIHRNHKASEPFQGLAEKRRRMHMRHHWTTELTVGCANPRGIQGAIQSFVDIRDAAWKPLDVERSRCRIVRTEPSSLALQVLDASIHERLHGLTGDQQILVEPRQIRLTVDDTSQQVEDGYFTGSPLHVEYPGPWPATFRERALVGPPWWFDLLCDIADVVDGQASGDSATWSPPVPAGSSWARSGGPFGPEAPSGDGRGKMVILALLAGALVMAGALAFAFTRTSSGDAADTGADPIEAAGTSPTTQSAEVSETTTQPPDEPAAVQVGQLFTGTAMATLIDEIAVANGTKPMQILSVLVYPEYLTAQVQGPGLEEGLVEYRWVGQLTPATPAPAPDDAAARLFGDDEVAWSAIPALIEAAPEAVGIESGVVTHLNVERPLPFSADIRVRVFVAGQGGDGFVDGDAAGTMVSINGN